MTFISQIRIIPTFLFFTLLLAPPLVYADSPSYESSQVCKKCHVDIYRNWKRSLHALSYKNPIFLTAYRKAYTETKGSAKKYCLNCHAPTVRVTEDYDADLAITKEGVTCDFCHTVTKIDLNDKHNTITSVPGDTKISVIKNAKSKHHKTEYSADFASSKLCAGCHSFVNKHGIQVGDTYREWLESPFADDNVQCQDCHMSEVSGRTVTTRLKKKIHDHSLSHNISTMESIVTLDIKKTQATKNRLGVQVDIVNIGAGHSIPTGTPGRHLVLEVRSQDLSGKVIESQKRLFHKVIVDENGVEIVSDGDVFLNGSKIVSDNRIKSQETREEKFVFSKRVEDISHISADVYFLYEPEIAQQVEMKIPLFSSESDVR